MAESANNDQERDTSYPRDEENQPDSPEQNQTEEASMIVQNPQEDSQPSTSAQQSTEKESGPPCAEKTKGSNSLTEHGKKRKAEEMSEKEYRFAMAESTNNEQERDTSYLRDEENQPDSPEQNQTEEQSTIVQNLQEIQFNLKSEVQDPPSPGLAEETPNRQESTGEKVNTESTTTEEKGPICVTYVWKKDTYRDTTGVNTPIIDFVKQTLKANSSSTKKFKYLFICAREYNAIVNPWVPCGALQKGVTLELDLKRMKSYNSLNRDCKEDDDKIVAPEMYKYPTFHDGLFFKVKCQGKTKGGKARKIIQMRQYYSKKKLMAVFGLKGQTIKEALQNDKRFTIPGDFSLEDSHCKTTTSKVLLSELKPGTYTIVLHESGTLRKRLRKKSSTHKDLQNNAEVDTSLLSGTSVPRDIIGQEKQSAAESESTRATSPVPQCRRDLPKSQPKLFSVLSEEKRRKRRNKAPDVQDARTTDDTRLGAPCDPPTLLMKTLAKHYEDCVSLHTAASTKFHNAFNNLPAEVKTELQNTILRNYISNVLYKSPVTAKLHGILNEHKRNVGIIGYYTQENTYTEMGTVFLLKEDLALTCHHVLVDPQNEYYAGVFTILFYYDEDPITPETYSAKATILFAPPDRDFAFLTVQYDNSSFQKPEGLLQYVAPPPTHGAVSIIGHPGGKCKKVDAMCSVINYKDRKAAIECSVLTDETFLHVLTQYNFALMNDAENVTYDTCMYHGASGSPVFNDAGMLVAMHSGGYYAETKGKKKSVIEYGRSIVYIIKYATESSEIIRQQLIGT